MQAIKEKVLTSDEANRLYVALRQAPIPALEKRRELAEILDRLRVYFMTAKDLPM